VAIAEGAHFRGSVDMQRKSAPQPQPVPKAVPAAAAPQPAAPVAAAAR
jgi:hypothetical protein